MRGEYFFEGINYNFIKFRGHQLVHLGLERATYQSKCHTDKDFYNSLLTVAAPSQRDDERIIYWFVFPSYDVKVGLRTGDVLLFNPMIPHCCSNPRIEGSTILSSYSSQTTLFRSVGGSCV